MQLQESTTQWNMLKKIAFRFFFIFFSLFIIIQNNGAFPLWGVLMQYPTEGLHVLIPWIGKHILQLPYDITVFTNGSGDTTYDYVIVFTITCLAVIGTLIWTIVDRKRTNYERLYYWLTVAIRFYVGLMLINYGLVKVIKLQFSDPGFYRLTQNYGDSSPMGLAWTFLGFSDGYNLFMGIAEVAAVLLLFRRTMTLGAIITLMTTANVMAVNYFYDVPVKILSTALFVMTFFLLMHDAPRLLRFFLTSQPVVLEVIKAPLFTARWMRIARMVSKVVIIGASLGYGGYQVWQYKQQADQAKPPLYGFYKTETFVVNNDTVPPLTSDSVRWQQLSIEWPGYASMQTMTNKRFGFTTEVDTTTSTAIFTSRSDTTNVYNFTYAVLPEDKLQLTGTMKSDTLRIIFIRKDLDDFLLTSRGFNWINEYPFNR